MKKRIFHGAVFLVATLFIPILITCLFSTKNSKLQIPKTDEIQIFSSESSKHSIDFEDYVAGIVLASISPNYEYEVIKAQAVIARTYALKNISVFDKKETATALVDILNPHSRGYTTKELGLPYIDETSYLDSRNYEELKPFLTDVKSAVKETIGEVITYKDELITPLFFSCCGGKTRNSSEVWNIAIPYLKSVDSNHDVECSDFMKISLFSVASVIEKLQVAYENHHLDASDYDYQVFETLPLDSKSFFDSIEIIARDSAGYVLTISLGGVVVSGEVFARVLSLGSS